MFDAKAIVVILAFRCICKGYHIPVLAINSCCSALIYHGLLSLRHSAGLSLKAEEASTLITWLS